MNLFKLALDTGPRIYYDPKVRSILEDHLQLLIEQADAKLVEVTPGIANKYLGDLNGVLAHAGVAPEKWWLIARMNGYKNHTHYEGVKTQFIVPDVTLLGRIIRLAAQKPVKSPNYA